MHRPPGILGVGPNPDVEILGGPDISVRRKRMGSDNEMFNAMRVECGQQIFEVLVHLRPSNRGKAE